MPALERFGMGMSIALAGNLDAYDVNGDELLDQRVNHQKPPVDSSYCRHWGLSSHKRVELQYLQVTI
jgi:hypothetical protein